MVKKFSLALKTLWLIWLLIVGRALSAAPLEYAGMLQSGHACADCNYDGQLRPR